MCTGIKMTEMTLQQQRTCNEPTSDWLAAALLGAVVASNLVWSKWRRRRAAQRSLSAAKQSFEQGGDL